MSSDKSAIERLRALLTERGVEWRKAPHYSGESQDNETIFEGNGIEWYTNDHMNGRLGLRALRYEVTPEQAVEATMAYIEAEREVKRLQDENAKLRELVADMWEYVKDYADALDAEVYGQVWPTVKHGYGDKVRNGLGEFVGFPDRMRELGIEVEDD